MKYLFVVVLASYVLSCAISSRELDRKFTSRMYDFDTYPYVFYRWCKKWSVIGKNVPKNCKIWVKDRIDITKEENFNKFKNADFGLINKSRL
jgi:hypothetical protein